MAFWRAACTKMETRNAVEYHRHACSFTRPMWQGTGAIFFWGKWQQIGAIKIGFVIHGIRHDISTTQTCNRAGNFLLEPMWIEVPPLLATDAYRTSFVVVWFRLATFFRIKREKKIEVPAFGPDEGTKIHELTRILFVQDSHILCISCVTSTNLGDGSWMP